MLKRFCLVLAAFVAMPSANACQCAESDESLEQLTRRSFSAAATVAVMEVMSVVRSPDGSPAGELAPVYTFKDTPGSPAKVTAKEFITKVADAVSSCAGSALESGDLMIAFVPQDGTVSFHMCSNPNSLLDFGRLELLYRMKREYERSGGT